MNLVDDHEPVVVDESGRVVRGSLESCRIVQQSHDRPGPVACGQPGQRALASLAGAVDQHNPGVVQRLGHEGLGVTGDQIR